VLDGLKHFVVDRRDASEELVPFRVLPHIGNDGFIDHDGSTTVLDLIDFGIRLPFAVRRLLVWSLQ
jgi:hypothetical protein